MRMPWDAATMEWIRRLPADPAPADISTLRVLRRTAHGPSETRLVDSLLARSGNDHQQERVQLERRVRYLKGNRNGEVRQRIAQEEARQVKQLAQALREQGRISPGEAEERGRGRDRASKRSTRPRRKPGTAVGAAQTARTRPRERTLRPRNRALSEGKWHDRRRTEHDLRLGGLSSVDIAQAVCIAEAWSYLDIEAGLKLR